MQGGLLGASSLGVVVVALLVVGLGVGCGLEWALPWLAMQRRQSILILRRCGWFFSWLAFFRLHSRYWFDENHSRR